MTCVRVLPVVAAGVLLGLLPIASQVHAADFDRRFAGLLSPSPVSGIFIFPVAWLASPADAVIRQSLPASVTLEGQTEWSCNIGPGGALDNCQLQAVWPKDPAYEQAGRTLLSQFILSRASVDAAQRRHSKVLFKITFAGEGLAKPDMKECPLPFCVPGQVPMASR